jgi:hypothetical protein
VQLRRALEVSNAGLVAAHAAQQARITALEAEVCVCACKRAGASVRVSACVRASVGLVRVSHSVRHAAPAGSLPGRMYPAPRCAGGAGGRKGFGGHGAARCAAARGVTARATKGLVPVPPYPDPALALGPLRGLKGQA